MSDLPKTKGQYVRIGLLLAALCIIYVPAVGHGFVKDDVVWIANSDFTHPRELLLSAPSGFYRPAVSVSFAVDRWACGTQQPFCYGATNFLLLIACAIAVLLLGRALSLSAGAAVLAAALWAFNWNGINMAVLWISGRTALVLVFFATAAAVTFVRGRWLLSALLMFGAMLSKEEAVLLPLALIAWWAIDSNRSVRVRSVAMFAAACIVAEGVYFFLRFHSGALTPATAPSYYHLSFTASRLLANAPEYLDRAATFSAAVLVIFWLVFRPRITSITTTRLSQIPFGLWWFVAALAITTFLPIRSSLYACLPSVGIAIAVASVVEALWLTLREPIRQRTIIVGLVVIFALMPVYFVRNRRYVREADLSSRTLKTLQRVAEENGPETVVVLHDDRTHKPSLAEAFGGLIQDAADLVVAPHVRIWLDSTMDAAALEGLPASKRIVELSLDGGTLVPTHHDGEDRGI
jgi:hypothetical protein